MPDAVPMNAALIDPASPQSVSDRPVRLLIITSGLLTGLSMTGLAPVLPAIQRDFSDFAGAAYLTKLVIAIVGLAVVMGAPLSSVIARRFRCADILIVCFAAYGVAAITSSLAPSPSWLIFSRFIQGLAVAIGLTTVLALAGTRYDGAVRDRLLGLHMGGSALMLLIVLPLTGYLGEMSWRLAPLLGCVALLHLLLVFKARRLLDFRFPTPTGRRRFSGDERRQALFTGCISLLIGAALYSQPAFLPFKLGAIGYGSAKTIGLMSTISTACSAVGSMFYARVRARLGAGTFYAVALGLGAAGSLAVAAADALPVVAAGLFIGGIGGGLIVTHLYGDSAVRFPADLRVSVTGLVKSSSFAGLFLGPLLIQVLVDRTSIAAAFVALAGISIAAFAIALLRPAAGTTGDPS
ncbi:MFS family permease [Sphingobium sp. OAS761]|uniref:MFS transporter n=1 Tax=Sphingobium sp. OAS761 TaxID=2817901 RepID=UPI00209C8183|nr:MFS transporter [Sphingobium sp. OAS761]MCP1471481.1 MFS family permease [Sphingobium sp. OAS761]